MDFQIHTTWDGDPVDHEPIGLNISSTIDDALKITVTAPFYDDPKSPPGQPGEPFDNLWDYEVVEAFFLNDENEYLEVEVCPHGQHLLLLLNGQKNIFKDKLPLKYTSKIDGKRWEGSALIPACYLPPKVSRFNAYAIHGSGIHRAYEALYPVPPKTFAEPDFHRLDYFKVMDMKSVLPGNWKDDYTSNQWSDNALLS